MLCTSFWGGRSRLRQVQVVIAGHAHLASRRDTYQGRAFDKSIFVSNLKVDVTWSCKRRRSGCRSADSRTGISSRATGTAADAALLLGYHPRQVPPRTVNSWTCLSLVRVCWTVRASPVGPRPYKLFQSMPLPLPVHSMLWIGCTQSMALQLIRLHADSTFAQFSPGLHTRRCHCIPCRRTQWHHDLHQARILDLDSVLL